MQQMQESCSMPEMKPKSCYKHKVAIALLARIGIISVINW